MPDEQKPVITPDDKKTPPVSATPAAPASSDGTPPSNTPSSDTPSPDASGPEELFPDTRDTTAEDEAHKKKMAALFDDIGEDAPKEDTVESLRAELLEARAQFAASAKALARSQADNLTLSRRVEDGKQLLARLEVQGKEDKQFAAEGIVKQMLPVIDTLELGINAIDAKTRAEDPKFDKFLKGVEQTLTQLSGVFNKFGVKPINPLNEAFDSDKHEAIMMQEKDGAAPETVVQVVQKGYEINGRIIRHAKVIVTPPA